MTRDGYLDGLREQFGRTAPPAQIEAILEGITDEFDARVADLEATGRTDAVETAIAEFRTKHEKQVRGARGRSEPIPAFSPIVGAAFAITLALWAVAFHGWFSGWLEPGGPILTALGIVSAVLMVGSGIAARGGGWILTGAALPVALLLAGLIPALIWVRPVEGRRPERRAFLARRIERLKQEEQSEIPRLRENAQRMLPALEAASKSSWWQAWPSETRENAGTGFVLWISLSAMWGVGALMGARR